MAHFDAKPPTIKVRNPKKNMVKSKISVRPPQSRVIENVGTEIVPVLGVFQLSTITFQYFLQVKTYVVIYHLKA